MLSFALSSPQYRTLLTSIRHSQFKTPVASNSAQMDGGGGPLADLDQDHNVQVMQ